MEFRVLGPVEVRSGGVVLPVRAPTRRALLAALLLSANQVVSVARLVDVMWGAAPPASAVANLRNQVVGLRRLLSDAGGARVVTRSGGYLLVVEPGELDLAVFDELVDRGRQAVREGQHPVAARLLGQALELWHGAPLENVTLGGAGEAEVARLREARLAVVEEWLRARVACGEHTDVISELRGLVVDHPLREPFWCLLILALHRAGRQADALAAYDQARHRLAEELGLDPGPELRRLHQQVLTGDLALLLPSVPEPRCDLPGTIGDFTGRAPELAELLDAVGADGRTGVAMAGVVAAVDGMAGVGKTTLAVRLARQLAKHYPDGQLFVDLRAHTAGHQPLTTSSALGTLLLAMGVSGKLIPNDVADRAALWRARLAGRQVLVVLDNAADSAQVQPLLPGEPECLVLVTSRRRLTGLDGAHLLSLDVLPHADAVALFEQVVGDTRPAAEPEAVAEVLALCGHLPLAIRIAAARLRHRPAWRIGHLAARLRDHQQRLAELRGEDRGVAAAFTLSYQQLTTEQQQLFRLLGLHPGHDIDPAAAAALSDWPSRRVERLLEDLVDVHLLVQPTAGRYRFHDLLRVYAANLAGERIADAEQRAASTRLLDHYLHTTSRAVDLLTANTPAPARDQALAWLETERTNLVAAGAHAANHGWPTHICALSDALTGFLHNHAHHDDALALHTAALAASRQHGDRAGEGRARHALGLVNWWLGHCADALDQFDASLAVFQDLGDQPAQALALRCLGYLRWRLGPYDQAIDHLEQALSLVDTTTDPTAAATPLSWLGFVHWQAGRYDQAADHFQRALALATAARDDAVRGPTLHGLGLVHWRTGHLDQAITCHQQAETIARDTHDLVGQGHALHGLGLAHRESGHHHRAKTHFQQALAIARQSRERSIETQALNGLGETARSAGNPLEALRCHEQALTIAEDTGERIEQARAHDGLGHAHHDAGDHHQARQHWHEALAGYRHLGDPRAHPTHDLLCPTDSPSRVTARETQTTLGPTAGSSYWG